MKFAVGFFNFISHLNGDKNVVNNLLSLLLLPPPPLFFLCEYPEEKMSANFKFQIENSFSIHGETSQTPILSIQFTRSSANLYLKLDFD